MRAGAWRRRSAGGSGGARDWDWSTEADRQTGEQAHAERSQRRANQMAESAMKVRGERCKR